MGGVVASQAVESALAGGAGKPGEEGLPLRLRAEGRVDLVPVFQGRRDALAGQQQVMRADLDEHPFADGAGIGQVDGPGLGAMGQMQFHPVGLGPTQRQPDGAKFSLRPPQQVVMPGIMGKALAIVENLFHVLGVNHHRQTQRPGLAEMRLHMLRRQSALPGGGAHVDFKRLHATVRGGRAHLIQVVRFRAEIEEQIGGGATGFFDFFFQGGQGGGAWLGIGHVGAGGGSSFDGGPRPAQQGFLVLSPRSAEMDVHVDGAGQGHQSSPLQHGDALRHGQALAQGVDPSFQDQHVLDFPPWDANVPDQ